jgi:hypothetical protein
MIMDMNDEHVDEMVIMNDEHDDEQEQEGGRE